MRAFGRHGHASSNRCSRLVVAVVLLTATTAAFSGGADADIFDRGTVEYFDRDTDGLLGQRSADDAFGHALAFGDFDADGWQDLAIGTPGDDIGTVADTGAVNVLPGSPGGLSTDGDRFLDLSDGFDTDDRPGDMFGYALATGDFDGDGYDDLAIGAPGRSIEAEQGGAVYISYGSADGLRDTGSGWQRWDQANAGVPGNQEPYDQIGLVLTAGDFDGDGYDDLAAGIPYEDQPLGGGVNVNNAGWVLMMFGTESGLNSAGSYAIPDPRLSSASTDARFGFALAAGDPNADGIDDLAVGAGARGFSSAQTKIAVFTGRADVGPSTTPTFEWPGANFEQGVRSLAFGDLDANGIDDLAVGLFSGLDPDRVLSVRFDDGGVLDETVLTDQLLPDRDSWPYGYDVAIGEFGGDGVGDLITTAADGRLAAVVSGRRGEAIGGGRVYPACCGGEIAVADVNRDGIDDAAIGGPATRQRALHWVSPGTLTGYGDVSLSIAVSNAPSITGPQRFLDTRAGGETVDGVFSGTGRNLAGETTRVRIAGRGNVPEGAVSAIVNVAVVDPAGFGFLTLYPCSDSVPVASTINYRPGETRANGAVPALSKDGDLCIFTLTDADIIVDVSGSSNEYADFVATGVPRRLLETRPGLTTYDGQFQGIGRAAAGSVTRLRVNGRPFSTEVTDLLINVAAVDPADFGFLTVYPCTDVIPNASNVNYGPGQTVANGVLAKVAPSGEICIFTLAETDIIVDLTGVVNSYSGVVPISPVRLVETRRGQRTADGRFEGIGRLDADSVLRVPIAGRAGIPADAQSALVNLTAIGSTAPGFLTVYPCGQLPVVSNVNYFPGAVVPNNATVRLAADGDVCLYTLAEIDLVVDVTGFGY